MPSANPLPTVIGPTENALRALLVRILSSTSIPGYWAWVVLNAMTASGSGIDRRRRAADGLKANPAQIDGVLAALRAAGMVDDGGVLTAAGASELATARAAVAGTTLDLVEGIDETDQETTRRVLDTIRRKAEELLSA